MIGKREKVRRGIGKTNNPNGRPKAGMAFVEQLRQAIERVGRAQKKNLMQHAVEQAYVDNSVLIAILRKLVPDLTEGDLHVTTELADALGEARRRIAGVK